MNLKKRLEDDMQSGLSRRDIAKRANVSEGTIRNILDGKDVSTEVLAKFADHYFHIPVDEVFRMVGLIPPPTGPGLRYEEKHVAEGLVRLRGTPFYQAAIAAVTQIIAVYCDLADLPPDVDPEARNEEHYRDWRHLP